MSNRTLDKKLSYWKQQLLDFSKRNRMINFRDSNLSTLKITEPEYIDLYNRIVEKEEELSFKRIIDEHASSSVGAIVSLLSALNEPLRIAIGDIGTDKSTSDMQKTLKKLRSESKLSLEERGSNILYLCIGFIEWSTNIKSYKTKSKSPLILVPVSIQMAALNAPFTLKKYDDDVVLNPTLSYLFEKELGYQLPDFDSDEDSIRSYLDKAEKFANSHGWRLIREAAIGLMSFQKISMYMDIERNEERLKENPIINALAGDPSMMNTSSIAFREIDTISPYEMFQVLNADSSQQEAILCSKQGLSFVMQGPPGTGKSQTIANIISEALGNGKKVLFVSEKMAALQVVYKRLEETHLADFCLPLHSYKANKKEIIQQLGKNLEQSNIEINDEVYTILDSLSIEREELNSYAAALHQKRKPLEMSCYEIYVKLLALQNAEKVNFDFPDYEKTSRTELRGYQRALEKYEEAVENIGFHVKNHPWRDLKIAKVGIEYFKTFSALLDALRSIYAEIIPLSAELEGVYYINEEFLCSDFTNITDELLKYNWVGDIPVEWFALKNINDLISSLTTLKACTMKLREILPTIEVDFYPEILEQNIGQWQKDLQSEMDKIKSIVDAPDDSILSELNYYTYKNHTLSTSVATLKQGLTDMEHLYHIRFDDCLDGAEKAKKFLELILQPVNYIPYWFQVKSLSDSLALAERFEKYTEQAKSFINDYGDAWNLEEWNIDQETLLKKFREQYTGSYLNDMSDRYLGVTASDYSALKLQLEKMKAVISTIIAEYHSLCVDTGLEVSPHQDKYSIFSELMEQIDCDFVMMPDWFEEEIRSNRMKDIHNAEKIAEDIKALENKILADWENASFALEYDPLLRRFEDEYKNIFKYFKKIYRDDRRNVQALSKSSTPKKLTDDDIIQFLNLLKEYKEKVEEFNTYHLSSKIGSLYNGEHTDWEAVRTNLMHTEKIVSVVGTMPKPLVKLICNIEKRHALVSKIKKGIADIQEHQETISEMCEVFGIRSCEDYQNLFFRVNSFLREYDTYEEAHTRDVSDICRFSKIKNKTYSDEYLLHFLESLRAFNELKAVFSENNVLLCNQFGTEYAGMDTNWCSIIDALNNTENIRQLLWNISDNMIHVLCSERRDAISDKTKQIYQNLTDALLSYERNSFFKLEAKVRKRSLRSLTKDLKTIENSLSQISALCDEIKPYCRHNIRSLISAVETVLTYHKIKADCRKAEKYLHGYLGTMEENGEAAYDDCIEKLRIVSNLKKSIFPEKFYKVISEGQEKRIRLTEICQKLQSLYPKLMEKLDWVNEQFERTVDLKTLPFSQSYEKVASCMQHFDQLEFWINFRKVRAQCCKTVLKNYIETIEEQEQFDDIKGSFLRTFYLKILDHIFFTESSLSGFQRNSHENVIKHFREDDEKQLTAAQARLRSMLIEQLPSSNSLIRVNDELSVLQKELNKRQKHMPLRKLFQKIPNLLMKLKPCFMMSPLSVSYFLEAETYHFDLVIFDEASQILPEDAIGAILRGKQVIIAGDIKQMPPTNFFGSSSSMSDFDSNHEEDDAPVAASILEEAAGTLPTKTLLWHYRSKQESLIAFSNSEIYNNKLITFPSNTIYEKDMGVEYIYVEDGIYESGGKNCNVKEAKMCVKLLKKHMIEHPDRSLGIIAFSEKQQDTIQREIDTFRIENPQYESFFESHSDEPFFVKNLENVQGDERDTIIFSICYAKNADGKIYMRFGPLGNQGGERRLNVAVTRAKCNVKLVGSLRPEELNLNKVKSDGVKLLRKYIEYAMQKENKKLLSNQTTLFSKDGFCDIIADFLTGEGFHIKRNVGCSDNKIDIAVLDPKNNDCYIAGIECDGYSYKKAKTARDRDSLRNAMLQKMGWNMYRVWSTEWICNEKAAKKQLLAFLNHAENVSVSIASAEKHNLSEFVKEIDKQETTKETDNRSRYGLSEYRLTPYNQLKPIRGVYDYDTISENILCILTYEQPISLNLLYKRLAPFFGIEKMTAKYKSAVKFAIKDLEEAMIDHNDFVWSLPQKKPEPRIPSDAETIRKIDDISKEEIEELMKIVISETYGLDQNGLLSECAAVFGYERRGAKINSMMNAVVEKMKNDGIIELIDEKIHIIGAKIQ